MYGKACEYLGEPISMSVFSVCTKVVFVWNRERSRDDQANGRTERTHSDRRWGETVGFEVVVLKHLEQCTSNLHYNLERHSTVKANARRPVRTGPSGKLGGAEVLEDW